MNSSRLNLRLPNSLYEKIIKDAEMLGISRNAYILSILWKELTINTSKKED